MIVGLASLLLHPFPSISKLYLEWVQKGVGQNIIPEGGGGVLLGLRKRKNGIIICTVQYFPVHF